MRKPLINIPKPKKQPKPIRKVSVKQAAKKQAMAQALAVYFLKHGWAVFNDDTEGRQGLCQLCGFNVDSQSADFHHKARASQAGNNTPENGLALHRSCHSFLHRHRDVEDAALESPANLANGLIVRLTDQRRMDLARFLGFGHSY